MMIDIQLRIDLIEKQLKKLEDLGAPQEEIDGLYRQFFILQDEIYCLKHYDEMEDIYD
jgi:hypothetical protein